MPVAEVKWSSQEERVLPLLLFQLGGLSQFAFGTKLFYCFSFFNRTNQAVPFIVSDRMKVFAFVTP
jgi:hypothetical protein